MMPACKSIGLIVCLLFLSMTCCACFHRSNQGATLQRIGVQNQSFVDQSGRVRIFHGFNAVQKGLPWYPEGLLNQTRLKLYKSWGFSAVRLGTMWSGLMPERGVINQTYLNILGDIVTQLEENGIYAIFDMHQDVLSSKFGTYDGAPLWLVDSLPPPAYPFPWPLEKISLWSEGYVTDATCSAFQAIYNNVANSRDYYFQFWETLAKSFKDKTSVLGYELMNEPWAGDVYSDPSLFLPGVAGSSNLMPTYDLLNEVIRGVDNETIVFYEPVTWGVVLDGQTIGTGFTKVPGGDAYKTKSALSYHYYCWLMDLPGQITKNIRAAPSIKREICDEFLGPKVFESVLENLPVTGGASLLTEFGECQPDGNPNSTATIECEFVLGLTDKHLQSWTYWDSQFFDGAGHVNWNVVMAFARPYARAIAGIPVQTSFDPQTKQFQLSFSYSAAIDAPTEIVVPEIQYPKGFQVAVHSTQEFQWTYDKENFVVSVVPASKDSVHSETIKVSITAKQ